MTNLQGDVVAIIDADGNAKVQYTYDARGKILSISGPMADTLGAINPLTYRGYVYDAETDLYYLQSRYYDPAVGRFINSDVLASTGQDLIGHNMFAYCGNNPVNRADNGGYFWDFILDVCSLVVSVVEVIQNPDDINAWIGLALDFVDVAVPVVGGLGEMADAFNAARKAVDKVAVAVETTHDIARTADVAEITHDISKTAKSVENTIDISTEGIKYTDKVINQMNKADDLYHGFPSIIDTFVDTSTGSPLKGGDGIMRLKVELPGSINNTPGIFEYIIGPDGMCNHRYFRELK